MNKAILAPAVQQFLRHSMQRSPASIALSKSPFQEVSAQELATQLDGMQRARKKLPSWHQTEGIYYAPQLASEQASSSLTAAFKASLVNLGDNLVDLTGGFGVDSYYFSLRAQEVTYCERQVELAQIAGHNAHQLGARNITIVTGDGMAYLSKQDNDRYHMAYLDPSRRLGLQKVFKLSDCEPNILGQQATLLQKCQRILLKAAPLLDISLALAELKNVKDVYSISANGEVKELLFLMDRSYSGTVAHHAIALHENGEARSFSFQVKEEQQAQATYSPPLKYLYEPDSALLKAGCFQLIAVRFRIGKLHRHTHLYTSDLPIEYFMGRSFNIIKSTSYGAFKKEKKGLRANVSCRNFPLKPEALRQRHGIKDGGDLFLFFCTSLNNELLVMYCRKTNA